MNKRKGLLFAAIAGLLLLNIWRWWPTGDAVMTSGNSPVYSVSADKLRLLLDPPFEPVPMGRNPFDLAPAVLPEPVVKPVEQAQAQPTQVHEPLAPASQVAAALGHLKLGGVVLRKGERYAYVMESGQGHLVGVGSVLFGRYRIEDISVRSVALKDVTSGASARLFLSEM